MGNNISFHHPDSILGKASREREDRTEKNRSMIGKDRGFHSSDIHKAAEELRMEGKGSHDPHYDNPKKNK